MSKVGLVTGPGSVSVPVHVDLTELRAALIASQHPLAQAPEWTGRAIYMALVYEPINLWSHRDGPNPGGVLSERVTRIVHCTARGGALGSPTEWPIVVQEVRDFVRQITKTKVVDDSIHVFQIACWGGHKKVSDIQTES
jgi:hypothetical protein